MIRETQRERDPSKKESSNEQRGAMRVLKKKKKESEQCGPEREDDEKMRMENKTWLLNERPKWVRVKMGVNLLSIIRVCREKRGTFFG